MLHAGRQELGSHDIEVFIFCQYAIMKHTQHAFPRKFGIHTSSLQFSREQHKITPADTIERS